MEFIGYKGNQKLKHLTLKIASTRAKMFFSREILRRKSEKSIFFARGIDNLGDSMVPWLIESITEKKYSYSNHLERRGPHLLSIGSILQYANSDCLIWGTGFIQKDSHTKGTPNSISAVRGPLTHSRLGALGIQAPNIYGDPALLTSRFLTTEIKPISGNIGLIPHFADWDTLTAPELRLNDHFMIIDIRTSDIRAFVEKIQQCEFVVSTSLHGLIISESFGIPVVWCEVSDRVVGKGFKFFDYFYSTGREPEAASKQELISGNLHKFILPPIKDLITIQDNLIEAFPSSYL